MTESRNPSPFGPADTPRRARRSRRRGRGLWLVLWISVLVVGGLPASADRWYEHYEKAERALQGERWREAVEELQEALERRGDSGSRVRTYGMNVVDYFPYLKLGIAYHELGQDDAALEAFDTEERLGVVTESPAALAQLRDYRQRVEQAQQAAAEEARRRTEEVVAQSLEDARSLQREGRLEEAMKALGPGLAVAPDHPEASELMATLRSDLVAQEEAQRQARETAGNLQAARRLLADGDAQGAARLLRQVLAVGPSPEAEELLEQAQATLVASVAAERRQRQIAEALTSARGLQAEGRLAEALDALELVFALEPDHPQAAALRRQLVDAQAAERQDSRIAELLTAAEEHLAAGRTEDALSTANRVLALERGQPQALAVVGRAYGRISQRVLGGESVENLPPAIRFADRRQALGEEELGGGSVEGGPLEGGTVEGGAGGERVEVVTEPRFRLTGVAIDGSPVTVEVLDGEGRPVDSSFSTQAVGQTFITEFSARRRLTVGSSVWTVVATDNEGLSSRSEYRVLYRRPWFRSPWLPVASATVSLVLFLLFWLRRWRERRQRLRRRFNPYVAGRPIFDHQLFFGREALVQRVLQTIHNNSLLLYGERRIGKTSLLHQIQQRLETLEDPEYAFYPVYIDLQGTPEEKFFATLADQIFESMAAHLDAQSPSLQRSSALGAAKPYTHHHLVRELHGLLKELQAGHRRRVKLVLLIDEVDELNHYDPRVNQSLRSLFMTRFAVNLAAVGGGVGIRKEWEKEGSPWYNFF
ncbi:MAG: AAA family ATPase, partial [Acidobacteriota bacterium]|nr:AAA family ATPase [Acidobacteriota bacterium]